VILLVDDDPSVTASLALLLKLAGHHTTAAATPAEALATLRREPCTLVIQDMNFSRRTSGEEGLELLRAIVAAHPRLPVILITAWGSIDLAVRGMKAGAADFITKPWNHQQVVQAVATALGLAAMRERPEAEDVPSREALDEQFDFGDLVGDSLGMRRVLQLIGQVAPTDASVLVTGETGTGKELAADAIHRNSPRAGRPLVMDTVGGLPTTLFDTEMFGHVRGAFTDARTDRKGRFELAHTGTIFLDEIGDLDPMSQIKLLRVLQDRTFEVVGSSTRRDVDVRVVSATHRVLPDLVARGDFREDLFYRLNLITVHLPPLRERPTDIPVLATRFLHTVTQMYSRPEMTMTDAARAWLQAQPWPGNVRQLRHAVERAVLVGTRPTLDADDLARSARMDTAAPPTADPLPAVGAMTLDEIERAMILKSLRHHGGNISRVAESLGLSRAALYRRFEKYEIAV
jgi:two-component system NtrC family response regulator